MNNWILLLCIGISLGSGSCEKTPYAPPLEQERPDFGVTGEYYDVAAGAWREFSIQMGPHPDTVRIGWVSWQSDIFPWFTEMSIFSSAVPFGTCCSALFQLQFWSETEISWPWTQDKIQAYFFPGRVFRFDALPIEVDLQMLLPIPRPILQSIPARSLLASERTGELVILETRPYSYIDRDQVVVSGMRVSARFAGRIGQYDPDTEITTDAELRNGEVIFFVRADP